MTDAEVRVFGDARRGALIVLRARSAHRSTATLRPSQRRVMSSAAESFQNDEVAHRPATTCQPMSPKWLGLRRVDLPPWQGHVDDRDCTRAGREVCHTAASAPGLELDVNWFGGSSLITCSPRQW